MQMWWSSAWKDLNQRKQDTPKKPSTLAVCAPILQENVMGKLHARQRTASYSANSFRQ